MRKLILCLAVLICALPSFAFDHTYVQYQSVLDRFVKNGKVDYEGLLQDREDLDAFVASYADVPFERYQAFTQRKARLPDQSLQCRRDAVDPESLAARNHSGHRRTFFQSMEPEILQTL